VGLTGCQADIADSEEPPVSHGGLTTDYISLIDNLRQAGATVEPAGELTQPFFSVSGRVIVVSGGDVQVFEYADGAAAEAEVALVSPDGSSIGTSMVSWIASPHFYQAGRLIVLYVGDGTDVINVLEAVLGQQFAGRSGTSVTSGDLEDISWALESYGEPGSLQTVLEGTEITALFDSAEGQISGSAGANHYFGSYQISKNRLSIQELAHTEMYRLDPEGVMEQETQYLKALQSAEIYEIEDGKMQIISGNQVLIFMANEE
ncbi:MAG: META domain-containing protein, partial [Dehalococcoidales bacterium]